MTFEEISTILAQVPSKARREIFKDGLAAAADTRKLERVRLESGLPVGEMGMRELAFVMCLFFERAGILDEVFPLEAISK
jgi:hypothetical protein